jgi:ABC-type nitrate/sulfonate/bicarbonate transport system ATPase subunit
LQKAIALHKARLGMVSAQAPLISNLDAWLNVALIRQYHENLPRDRARREVLASLDRFGMGAIADRRISSLEDQERFCIMLLRAAMVKRAVLVIDRPFQIMPDLQDARYVGRSLKWIDDLYEECHIFDYVWMKDHYGALHGEEH